MYLTEAGVLARDEALIVYLYAVIARAGICHYLPGIAGGTEKLPDQIIRRSI
jgi:hypothetical protein